MTEQDLLQKVEALIPMLEDSAAEAEHQRKPVDRVMQAIEDIGIYHYFVPKEYGGYEFGMETFMRIGMALGEGCVSTGWVTTFCMEHNWLIALFNKQAQDQLFGQDGYVIAPGTLAPMGKATPVEGGYRVTGRWAWGTGVMHANWVLVGAITPVQGAQAPDLCVFAIPIEQVEIIDTWNVSGMSATGSNDIAVNDVFVPAHLMESASAMRQGNAIGGKIRDSYLYKMPMLPVLGLTAASPAVGAARKVVKLFADRMASRIVYGTTDKQGEKGVAQHRLGQAALKARNAEILLMQLAAEVEQWGKSSDACPEEEKTFLRLRIGDVVRQCREVVTQVVEASGAHAHFLDSPLQRFQRDLNTLSCHTVFDTDISAEQVGRSLLELDLNMPL